MAPRPRAKCQICEVNESKYTCATCKTTLYCSVPCYKQHKELCAGSVNDTGGSKTLVPDGSIPSLPSTSTPLIPKSHEDNADPDDPPLEEPKALRPLTSLNWPYVPEESAFPDPLKRDDPKALQLHQYEAIATSPAIRAVLESNPRLPALLIEIDKLRGPEREDALQRALGVDSRRLNEPHQLRSADNGGGDQGDMNMLRALAEAVEAAARGGKEGVLGLDWDDSS
ncbi:hypothetical protein BJ138DRAFT_1167798 [Hygrophoropsis aurantiaca]|uniref:Uncharacterized protein n=1 Tax=Hygrophoropsis aurantiaca TaxID=72124 RepID=A0ACB7ZSK1_9AGAM|nr:hypothetical protein BJ138DRAFT_1167798 [Hygrophoropsis aurantiaca]